MRDVVLAHAERALQQQRLGHGGVEPAVGVRLAGQRGVGDRRVLEREPQRAPVVRVEVADPHAAVAGGRGLEVVLRDLLDVPVAPDRLAQRDAPLVVEAGQQAVRGEDRQPRVAAARRGTSARTGAGLRRRSRPRTRARSRSGGGRRRSAARRARARPATAAIASASPTRQSRWVVPSSSVTSPNGGAVEVRGDRRPGVAVVEREDRGEVRARGAREPQPVLLRARVGALVRADPARAVVLDAHAREQAVARAAAAVRAGVVLLERPQRRARGRRPRRRRRATRASVARRVGVRVVAAGLRQVDLDDVVRRAGDAAPRAAPRR